MSVLKYFKNTARSPPIGRQALSVIFFFKFAMRSLEKKGPVARWGATELFFFQRPHCEFEKTNLHLRPVAL